MFNYEIGGNERKIDASEAFADIAHNKTLFVQKLTENEPIQPEKVEGLQTVKDVFNHYRPNVTVELEKYDGSVSKENLQFSNLGDFSVKSIITKSAHLNDVSIEKEMSLSICKQLKSNKTLKTALEGKDTRTAFLDALKSFISELEESEKTTNS